LALVHVNAQMMIWNFLTENQLAQAKLHQVSFHQFNVIVDGIPVPGNISCFCIIFW